MPGTSAQTKAGSPDQQFPVVGIGASAGGVEAFKLFLETIPEKSGMAFVFVMHLSPTHESYLPEILQKFSKIPITSIADNEQLQPDHIYIIPPDKMLTTVDGALRIEPAKARKIKTIDLFFSSLALAHQSFAVGVVLSGSLDDGTVGLQVIKSYGGLTFAQDESAAFDSMPKSAISSGAVDFVLPASKIISKLIAVNQPFHPAYSNTRITKTDQEEGEDVFRQLLTLIRIRKGVDFNNYKQSTIKRRIMRRMALNKHETPLAYLNFLRENKNEQDALFNDLLISVTSFFRDQRSFELLCNVVLPNLIEQKVANEPLRIWVAGCATGEEAYSMAICILEYMGDKAAARKIQIFATDVSEIAIARARTGIYRQDELTGLSTQQIQQFFIRLDGSYQVAKSIRDMCVFAHHNLLKDPPFSKIDLVSCRNVLIYMEPVLQKRAISTFHYALNEKGYLMLGKSETIGNNTDLFNPFNIPEKIYQSKGPHGRFRTVSTLRNEQTFKEIDQKVMATGAEKDIRKKAEAILLDKYTPASVIVNQVYDIVDFCGNTDNWLALPKRKPSFNILKMAREGLSFEIRNLLHLAKTKQVAVRKEGIAFKEKDEQHYVNIEVVLLPDEMEDYYLVVFQNSKIAGTSFLPGDAETGTQHPQENVNAWIQRIEQLEKELGQTREDMRSITEVQEAANEELQSANEELLSGSEELQSLNEELETSREELQSTNEEIIIINTELLDRNEQLNSSRRYTEEIFNTIHDPLLILDHDLTVIRATDGYYQMFNVDEGETEGSFLYDLGNKQWDISSLRSQLENILPEKGSFKAFEVNHNFNGIGLRTMRLTARQFDTHAQKRLILLAIHDITDQRKVEEGLAEVERLLAESKERLRFAIESAGIGTWDYNPISGELVWDHRCRQLHGVGASELIDYKSYLNNIFPADRQMVEDAIATTLHQAVDNDFNAEYRTINSGGEFGYWIKSKGRAYFNGKDVAVRFIGTVLDISPEKEIEIQTKDLLDKKDAFISIASHELKTPVTSLKASLQLMTRMKDNPTAVFTKLLEQSSRSMERISRLIDDLLNVNNMNEGHLEVHKTIFRVADMLRTSCSHLEAEGIYEVILDGDKELQVFGDEPRLEQVVVNIVNNAVKYAPASKKIRLTFQKENEHIRIAITDFGPGIPDDKRELLFNRYYRASYAGHYSGLGLGLYISSEIVKRHGGEIGVDSELGKGSTFWFTLPALS
jgi:two-component system CheB/CheR fusion protein